jgi:hypothetical protein
MLPLLRGLLPLFNVAALLFVAQRRRVLRTLRQADADTESRAIPVERSGLKGWWLKRLAGSGVLKHTSQGAYWIDEQEYSRYRRVRLLRAAVVLLLLVATLLLLKR